MAAPTGAEIALLTGRDKGEGAPLSGGTEQTAPDFTAAITESDVAGGIIPSVQPALIKKYAADLRHRGTVARPADGL